MGEQRPLTARRRRRRRLGPWWRRLPLDPRLLAGLLVIGVVSFVVTLVGDDRDWWTHRAGLLNLLTSVCAGSVGLPIVIVGISGVQRRRALRGWSQFHKEVFDDLAFDLGRPLLQMLMLWEASAGRQSGVNWQRIFDIMHSKPLRRARPEPSSSPGMVMSRGAGADRWAALLASAADDLDGAQDGLMGNALTEEPARGVRNVLQHAVGCAERSAERLAGSPLEAEVTPRLRELAAIIRRMDGQRPRRIQLNGVPQPARFGRIVEPIKRLDVVLALLAPERSRSVSRLWDRMAVLRGFRWESRRRRAEARREQEWLSEHEGPTVLALDNEGRVTLEGQRLQPPLTWPLGGYNPLRSNNDDRAPR